MTFGAGRVILSNGDYQAIIRHLEYLPSFPRTTAADPTPLAEHVG